MPWVVDAILVLMLLFNFAMLGSGRILQLIKSAALQGFLLGVLMVAAPAEAGWRALLLALASMALKGFVIPSMLMRALKSAGIRREVEPLIPFLSSLVLVAVGTGLGVLFSNTLPLVPEHSDSLLVPASLSTVLTGFLILTSRRKAITQVIGYLTLENGVFLFGLLLVDAMPTLVEVGVLLDLLVAIFVFGIILQHIDREFAGARVGSETAARLMALGLQADGRNAAADASADATVDASIGAHDADTGAPGGRR
jgi:hydrogenase-4 component E